jgi:uncharacterized protein (TIGR02722 family)
MRVLTNALFLLLSAQSFIACTPGFEGEYSDPAKTEIVDDKWNETDARKTAQHMIQGMLEKPWLATFQKAHGGQKPIVIVTDVKNMTDEHLDVQQLTDYIQDELINSGKVRFVDKARRQQILDEINFQNSGAVDPATAKKKGKQIGADFMLAGNITSQVHTQGEKKTVSYQPALTHTNFETAEIEWSTKYQIQKTFRRSGAGW